MSAWLSFLLSWRCMRQGLAGRRVLCAGHQDSASLVGVTLVQLAIWQVVWFILAHGFFFAVLAACLKSLALGAALEPTLFIFSPEPALMRSCLALMFA